MVPGRRVQAGSPDGIGHLQHEDKVGLLSRAPMTVGENGFVLQERLPELPRGSRGVTPPLSVAVRRDTLTCYPERRPWGQYIRMGDLRSYHDIDRFSDKIAWVAGR
jgi:hypothetical protein